MQPYNDVQAPVTKPELFVYLCWQTLRSVPYLADDQLQQVAYQAIQVRTRMLSCHLLAIDGTHTQIHAIFRFPASLAVSHLAQISMQASEEAICKLERILYSQQRQLVAVWERKYAAKTLSREDITQAAEYLRRQIQVMPRKEL